RAGSAGGVRHEQVRIADPGGDRRVHCPRELGHLVPVVAVAAQRELRPGFTRLLQESGVRQPIPVRYLNGDAASHRRFDESVLTFGGPPDVYIAIQLEECRGKESWMSDYRDRH